MGLYMRVWNSGLHLFINSHHVLNEFGNNLWSTLQFKCITKWEYKACTKSGFWCCLGNVFLIKTRFVILKFEISKMLSEMNLQNYRGTDLINRNLKLMQLIFNVFETFFHEGLFYNFEMQSLFAYWVIYYTMNLQNYMGTDLLYSNSKLVLSNFNDIFEMFFRQALFCYFKI